MAFKPRNINPIDLRKDVAVGVSLPFDASAVFAQTFTTKDAIKSNIINYFLTDRGERVFSINFGSGLRSKIFEQITPQNINDLKDTISEGIHDFFPYIKVNNVNIDPDPDENTTNISIDYSIVNTGQNDNLSVLFQNN